MNNHKYLNHFVISLLFTGFIFAFESIYLPFVDTRPAAAETGAGLYLLTLIPFVLLLFFVFFALASPYGYRLAYLAVFAPATIVEYGYYSALQHFSTAEDLENVIFGTNLDNQIDAIMMFFNRRALIPCLIFLVLIVTVKPLFKGGRKHLALIASAGTVFFLVSGWLTDNNYPIAATGAFYRTVIGSPFKLNYLYLTPRELIEYKAPEAPRTNIVMIIDESISGNHLSLNGYSRPTTPRLDELDEKGLIRNWGLAVSGTTCSITSNKLLLTGITDLPDTTMRLMNDPLIFQYAKAMGYKTFYFDGQMDNLWSLSDFDRQFLDEYITRETLQTENDFEIDGEIARRINELVKNSTGNFIWVNKRGTHTPYHRAYPKSAEVWSPVFFADPLHEFSSAEETRQAYINSHDNAVKYNLELFFSNLLPDGKAAENTYYLYTSDHGQNLLDVPEQGSHCGNTPQMVVVPLFLISAPENLPQIDTGYRASHSNIFPTLLDLMNFPENERRYQYDLSLLKAGPADSKQRYYFVGDLTGRGKSEKEAFDERIIISKK